MVRKADPALGETDYIKDEHFRIQNPGRKKGKATGIGCGGTRQEAEANGRDVSRFNLRGVTGPGDYNIIFRVVAVLPHPTLICVEMEADATP